MTGKEAKIPLKDDDKDIVEGFKTRLDEAKKQRDNAKTQDEKLQAAAAVEEATAASKADQARRFKQKHMFKNTPNVESLDARISKHGDEIRKLEVDVRDRDENKEVSEWMEEGRMKGRKGWGGGWMIIH